MNKTKEKVVNLTIDAGNSSGSVSIAPPAGIVIGCVIYTNQPDVIANASIKSDSGEYISEPQHIANYRSREASYFDGCKPLMLDTQGKTFHFEVIAETVFAEDFKAQLIFIYEDARPRSTNC